VSEGTRVLIRAPNWLGDAVMALPAMAAVRAAFPDRRLVVAGPTSIAPLFLEATSACADEVLTVEKASESSTLRAAAVDIAILLPNSFRVAWAARRAGIGERWGFRAHARGLLLTRAVRRPRGRRHQSEYYLHLVRQLGYDAPAALPSVTISAGTRARVEALLERLEIDRSRPLVGLAPGAAYGHAKRWPPDRVAQLVRRLATRGVGVVLVGAPGDREAAREIESAVGADAPPVNLVGRTDLRLFAGVLAACDAFVSNDSGAMHLAAAAGVPVVAVFGPTDERATAPLGDHDVITHQVFCRPCMLRECPIDHRCMRRISVDTVLDAVIRRLAQSARLAARGAS
jgi:heptosyltransferase II